MPRKPRFAPPGHYLHITQRGNYGQQTFFAPRDNQFFLHLLVEHAAAHHVDILAYCLMPNHYHLLARPNAPNAISRLMRDLNGRYSRFLHGRLTRTGRLWQDRFFACILAYGHLFSALRYVERNPVRAALVDDASLYPWSSAPAHTNRIPTPAFLDSDTFLLLATPADWPQILATPQSHAECATLRRATHTELHLTQCANAATPPPPRTTYAAPAV